MRPGRRAEQEDGESAVLAALAAMSGLDRALGERLQAIIKANAPALSPRLRYGMPAYCKEGKVVCIFQNAQKFKTRYATLGFMHAANLDDGAMWRTAFALQALTPAEEAAIAALLMQAPVPFICSASPAVVHRRRRSGAAEVVGVGSGQQVISQGDFTMSQYRT